MEIILSLLLQYKYLFFLPLAIFQGSIASLISGFLVNQGVLSFGLVCLFLLLGDLIPDTIFYHLGYYGRDTAFVKRYLSRAKIFSGHLDAIVEVWTKHCGKTIFLGKMSYGFTVPFLLTAGMAKVPFPKFIAYATAVAIVHYGLLFLIGYSLGHSYLMAEHYANIIHYTLSAVVVILLVIYFGLGRYISRKVL